MTRGEKAKALFEKGYNCCQAVTLSFSDVLGLEEKTLAALASGFGGGMGRMREVCGAVSGMLLVLGTLDGYDTPGDDAGKKFNGVTIAYSEKFTCHQINIDINSDTEESFNDSHKNAIVAKLTFYVKNTGDEASTKITLADSHKCDFS